MMIDRRSVLVASSSPSHSVAGSAGPADLNRVSQDHWQTGLDLCFDVDLLLHCFRACEVMIRKVIARPADGFHRVMGMRCRPPMKLNRSSAR